MDILKIRKRVLKASLTRHKDKITTTINDSDSVALQLLESKTKEILNDLKLVFNSIFETCQSEELEEFIKEKEGLEDSIDELILQINRKLIQNKTEFDRSISPVPSCNSNIISEVKLPTLSIPTFNGKIENWIMFKDMFNASVIENKSISNAMKLQYLKASCKDESLRVIQSISISDANFDIAWKLLEDRYSNQRELLNAVIKKLLYQPNIIESPNAILNLIDITNECVRTLEILKYKVEDLSEIMIVFMIIEKFDKSTRYWYEKEFKNSEEIGSLKQLLSFLQSHARTLQNSKVKETKKINDSRNKVMSMISTSNSKNTNFKCPKCEKGHYLHKCQEFLDLSINDRNLFVKQNSLCFNCLKPHPVKFCVSTFRCRRCFKNHSTLLHFDEKKDKQSKHQNDVSSAPIAINSSLNPNAERFDYSENKLSFAGTSVNGMNQTKTVFLSTAIIYVKDCFGKFIEARAMIDNGSMNGFVTISFANLLGIKREKINTISVLGLSNIKVNVNSKIRAVISNKSDFEMQLDFLCIPKISDAIPINDVRIPLENLPQNIKFADPNFYCSNQIDVLLSAEIAYKLLKSGQIQMPDSNLIFQNSVFGFIATGSVTSSQSENSQKTHCGLISSYSGIENRIEKFWQLENLGILDDPSKNEVDEALEIFEKTVRFKNNRYEVNLPWKRDWGELNDNFMVARKRLNSLMQRLKKDPILHQQYRETISDYEKKNIIEKITFDEKPINTPVYYMPHQPVLRNDSSTTKMRIVFDASSCFNFTNLSLNDCLWSGKNLNSNIFDILVNFRLNKIAFVSDIEKAFLQISLAEKDRNAVRFLWEENGVIQIYRFNRVLFGVTSSPFLLTATLKLHFERFRDIYPTTTQCLNHCFFVDDFISGTDDVSNALELSSQAISILSQANMTLRKWVSNDGELMQHWENQGVNVQPPDSPIKVLGMFWDPVKDNFIMRMQSIIDNVEEKEDTKRFMLKTIGKIFDPLGLLSPFTIRVKCMLQALWKKKISWDEDLPSDICEIWSKWCQEVPRLSKLEIPRYVLNTPNEDIELHVFSDASKTAYGVAIYTRVVKDNQIVVNLLVSKSRVAPLKNITLPRLELLGALLAARLANTVKTTVDFKSHSKIFFWTDSKITLYWIQGSTKRWKPFIANRVSEIKSLCDVSAWAYCPGNQNPSDFLTRGISVDMLLHCDSWWYGPQFLKENLEIPYNSDNIPVSLEEVSDELKKTFDCEIDYSPVTFAIFNQSSILDNIISCSNNYVTIINIMCYIFRFLNNLRCQDKLTGHLTFKESKKAELFLISLVQQGEFKDEIKCLQKGVSVHSNSKLKSLNCFLDECNVLRVGGRLKNSNLGVNEKHPIILPDKHPLTLIIVNYYHLKYLHLGSNALLYLIRRKFWILNGRNVCRKIVFKCVQCFKAKPILENQIMGDLPKERVVPSYPFTNVGCDFCGPFLIKFKNQRKGKLNKIYVSIFVCLSTKSIHLDFVSDLTSEAFIACLKRLFSRRGKCSKLFSDNAKTFIGADIELKKLHKMVNHPDEVLAKYLSSENIDWKFIPPKSPNFGGLWEAGVKSFKFHLKRIIGNAHLYLEEFLTIILEIESVLNSRPLTPLSSEFDNFETLSPGHFLIGRPLTSISEPQIDDIPENRLSKWRKITKYSQQIWKLWKRDYLNNLQQRGKWRFSKNNVKLGTLVLIKDEHMPSTKWLTGRITELIFGKDKKVRVINVQIPNGNILKRNIRDICILPIYDD